ncbi:DUF2147 domain-containing protein [Sphingomonas faeni]|uniref:DUF2147 domain-containing protein n=1 Tax=Sphingomonas faeni TaxID=185950 RepID=UPI002783D814|nr:DUF2147 domain-containing protein [Sphingomonas faeni]MDQ0837775.1 uncharacterized protein (DUF2147 family) [Sphingomonas faeni]
MLFRCSTAIVAMALIAAPASARTSPPAGVWANPRNTVHVTFKRCRDAICGTVIWASRTAIEDARAGGADRLVGEELFRDFVEDEPGRWSGEVFIPDVGQTVSGTITQGDARTLIGEGCMFAGFGCKTQSWKRIK